jgi:PhzF family phenazine biosynthesis protein
LDAWLDDETMQAIAMENNLSETAFFVPEGDGFRLRWFTPSKEVSLCGHATLATAFVIFTRLEPARQEVCFETLSGPLWVRREGDRLAMDFPARQVEPCHTADDLIAALGRPPERVLATRPGDQFIAVYATETEVRAITPDHAAFARLGRGVAVTAPGDASDCASRYFASYAGVPEDPVTGSIHCALVPYWAQRLGKREIHARQVSRRGGELFCEDQGARVKIAGYAVQYMEGTLHT